MLKRLSLHRATLDDESITDIGDSLVKNKVLNYLDLSGNHQITPAGWHGFSICLRSPTCALQDLHVKDCKEVNGIAGALAVNTSVKRLNISNCSMTNAGAIEIADALAVNSTLKVLNMNWIGGWDLYITAEGWVAFFALLTDSVCSLEELYLEGNQIGYAGAAVLVDLLAGMITLKCLKLTCYNLITTDGWRVIAGQLQTISNVMCLTTDGWRVIAHIPQTSSNVISLHLGGDNVNNDIVISFAAALVTNKCLRNLILHGHEITDMIWGAFSDVLCDDSSVQSTYHSNHTLQSLQINDQWNRMQIPDNIARVLKLNSTNEDKVALARQKIIAIHFSDSNTNTRAFF